MPTQTAIESEAPPQEQEPQENHADEAAAAEVKRVRNTRPAIRRRQQAFARAYATPGTLQYLNATKAAIAAGYATGCAASQGCQLLKKPQIREWITAFSAEIAERMAAETAVTVEYVKQQHLQQMHECRAERDRTNAREHLEDLGRMVGAYDLSLHLDLTVKHEYDERLAVEASRIARVLIEEAGDRGLTLLDAHATLAPEAAPVDVSDRQAPLGATRGERIDSQAAPDAPGSTRDALVRESVKVEGERTPQGTLERTRSDNVVVGDDG